MANQIGVNKAMVADNKHDNKEDDKSDLDPNNPNADQNILNKADESDGEGIEFDEASDNDDNAEANNDDDDDNDAIAAQKELDCELVDEMIQDRHDQMEVESSEVIGGKTISKERLKEMKDPFVFNQHTGKRDHKKSIIKDMNEGRSVNNSMDRKYRNAGELRFG